jgi:hypothetical protein
MTAFERPTAQIGPHPPRQRRDAPAVVRMVVRVALAALRSVNCISEGRESSAASGRAVRR